MLSYPEDYVENKNRDEPYNEEFLSDIAEFRGIIRRQIHKRIDELRQLTPEQVEGFIREQLYNKEEQERGNIRRQMTVEPAVGSDGHTRPFAAWLMMEQARFQESGNETPIQRTGREFITQMFRELGVIDALSGSGLDEASAMPDSPFVPRRRGALLRVPNAGGDNLVAAVDDTTEAETDTETARADYSADLHAMLEIATGLVDNILRDSPDGIDRVATLEEWAGSGADFRRFVGRNPGMARLMEQEGSNFSIVRILYAISPSMVLALSKDDTLNLMEECNVPLIQVIGFYQQSPAKLDALSKRDVRLMLENNQATLEQVSQVLSIYNISPELLERIAQSSIVMPDNEVFRDNLE